VSYDIDIVDPEAGSLPRLAVTGDARPGIRSIGRRMTASCWC